ncbi:hypothetical protein H8356DRAFT_945849 [Neocallimastix lanati (nom. inval.)]|uniref:Uncharacterized protein n=1 Tax=Neocallimastix californiae TaxID=1754190 RepID=A0A1Y2A5F4_9FUNG|nr:hypothetical protein H8356DRAFT_945849 [Neocallimastix sp. JGI-2020a]ORY17724.1 hypothetical protein LY90DRAFT_677281 [Neocallimastix californiae]|eukprot:ORY17724.1 hypothetical protein LY90DRAFT_677281 [Neocallimastix californiae]
MDINQDNLTEKLQLLKLLIQKGSFGTGVSDDVDELDEFVDGESMGILALVDNKEARCILKGYGENNLVNRSFLEKYILNHCIDDSSITGITKLTILNLTIGGVQKNIKGSANIKKNQNNSIEINSIVIINNKENINSNSKNKNIINNSENIRNKINSHIIVKEEININESVKVDSIFNRINKSITPERKINNNNSPVDFSNIINIDSDKKIKINKIKKNN